MRLASALIMLLSLLQTRPVAAISLKQSRRLFLYGRRPTTILISTRLFSGTDNDAQQQQQLEPMAKLYTEWSLEDDRLLFANRKKSLPDLAALLGRGLRGVESRLDKLTDVNSPAYARLFAAVPDGHDNETSSDTKLTPAREVLRRIQWDYALDEADFSVVHYDRVDNVRVESSMTAPNTSVSGKETKLVLAIPEHRIEAIKYREQIVWDKENRVDRVFGSMGGKGQTIHDVIANYDEWKREKDAAEELSRIRQAEVTSNIQCILGDFRFAQLTQLSSTLLDECREDQSSMKKQVESYVQEVLELFREARLDESSNSESSLVPSSDYDALDTFSEFVAVVPYLYTRPLVLLELEIQRNRLADNKQRRVDPPSYILPELNEDDLTETFVRGSGAGGQKINKTSNCVVLVHGPTQLRVECQETRSLQQNRKIARKRLRLKLDEYLNGSQSKTSLKNSKASSRKAKAKARSKTRLKKKKETDAE